MTTAFIREIFKSIQGEGPHVGESQLFVRFCGCNLACRYCDTDFEKKTSTEYTAPALIEKINTFGKNLTISITGGEPLLSTDFLLEVLPQLKSQGYTIYLETNSTLPEELKKVVNYVDIIAADIKLPSATGLNVNTDTIKKFFEIAKDKEIFAKIVFNSNITEEEIINSIEIARANNIEIILQPETQEDNISFNPKVNEEIFEKFIIKYNKVRLIPQMHKFLNLK